MIPSVPHRNTLALLLILLLLLLIISILNAVFDFYNGTDDLLP